MSVIEATVEKLLVVLPVYFNEIVSILLNICFFTDGTNLETMVPVIFALLIVNAMHCP